MLESLTVEGELHGQHLNLLAAATGTGKTMVAALDYPRHCPHSAGDRPTLLFVGHRREMKGFVDPAVPPRAKQQCDGRGTRHRAVRQALRGRPIAFIRQVHPDLAAHLDRTVRTGVICRYQPEDGVGR